LGTLIAHAAEKDLKARGTKRMMAGYSHSESRARQLERLGLPADREVPIDEWLKKMRDGAREALARMRKK